MREETGGARRFHWFGWVGAFGLFGIASGETSASMKPPPFQFHRQSTLLQDRCCPLLQHRIANTRRRCRPPYSAIVAAAARPPRFLGNVPEDATSSLATDASDGVSAFPSSLIHVHPAPLLFLL
ncbi:hypothetical protein IWX50DRAFT_644215 [Phyllosticta citricarpa]